jgi:hypothetical protein
MAILHEGALDLTSVSDSYDNLSKQRLLTTSASLSEITTVEGVRYYGEVDEIVAATESLYILYQMPPLSSGVIVALQQRLFKSLNGEATLEILWDSTGIAGGVAIPTFNENRNSANTANMTIARGITVTSDGIIRERDFLAGSGKGRDSSGGISPAVGTRLYSPDSFFIAKITNLHNSDNRIHISYSWAELSTDNFKGL